MPEIPLVDTHLHLWDLTRLRYPWLEGHPQLGRNFLPEDFRAAGGDVQVGAMVFVQCDAVPEQAVAEARWVAELARTEPRIKGIVARATLERGEAAHAQVAELAEIPLVKGVRRLIQGEADPEFPVRPDFVRGVQLLHGFGLSFDLCLKHHQLAATIRLVRQCPDVSFVLDHIAKPDIKAGRLDPWRAELRELAQLENVTCKISGLATEANWAAWTTAQLRPYIEHVIACFGFDRVMFGGDWPVSTLATTYPRWVAAVDEVLGGCSREEREKFWVRNAERIYRL
jgi:L-fuconolactonase